MLESHPHLETPESSTSIWRYMAIDKFLHLLGTSTLWFTRCDRFEDGWEGHYSDATVDAFKASLKGDDDKIDEAWARFRNMNRGIKQCLYLNCWHINEEESAALWQIYSKDSKSIAIKSTVHRLRDALRDTELSIYGARVKYLDYANEPMPWHNLFTPFVRKRRSFAFENELRLLHWEPGRMPWYETAVTDDILGMPVPVNLDVLVESVFLSPQTESFFRDAVQSLLKRFELSHAKLEISNLFRAPS